MSHVSMEKGVLLMNDSGQPESPKFTFSINHRRSRNWAVSAEIMHRSYKILHGITFQSKAARGLLVIEQVPVL